MPAERDANLAGFVEAVASARVLCTFLREVGGARALADDAPDGVRAALRAHGAPLEIELGASGRRIYVAVARSSSTGHHELAGPVFLRAAGGGMAAVERLYDLAAVLLEEIAARDDQGGGRERVQPLAHDVADSLRNTQLFAAGAARRAPTLETWLDEQGAASLVAAEQALVFGHPFHPTPKSCTPSDEATLARFRPELGASFALHYFAIAPRLLREDRLAGAAPLVAGELAAAAAERLPAGQRSWPLVPCHPWQAELLRARSDVHALVDAGALVPLGPIGGPVHPTSSVRTVYVPGDHGQDRFYKLPLDVRITNFVRTNPLDHLARSLSASRALVPLRKGLAARGLHVLAEVGYRGLDPQALPANAGAATAASLAVLFREGPGDELGAASCAVVAAFLEPPLPGRTAPLAALVKRAARSRRAPLTAAFVCAWLKRYLSVGLEPMLALFLEHGLSLEAHAQNTLIAFDEGWPWRCYVRDLEGTSLGRGRRSHEVAAALAGHDADALTVDDAEAWQRLVYYLLVNQTAHLIATLAAHGPAEEWQLWQVVRAAIQDLPLAPGTERAALDELLTRAVLPAKANLVSRFADRAERPIYVSIPNPLCAAGPC